MGELSGFAYNYILGALIFLCFVMFFCLLRAIFGKGLTDRILGVNMICTVTVMMICLLSCILGESYLLDVGILFALLAIVIIEILTRVVITQKSRGTDREDKKDDN